MPSWIDFKELRSKVSIADVLTHYGVEIKAKGKQHLGFCPLPKHGGNRRSPSFSVNLEENIFHCFGCQAKGNQLDLAVFMEGKSPENGRELREVALLLRRELCATDGKPTVAKKVADARPSEASEQQRELPLVVNPPLDFELQGLDAAHPYLLERGFVKETVAHFGLGYCARGYHVGRIAIPLHSAEGRVIGYAGRIVDDSKVDEENPRYLFPAKREREGTIIEFHKSAFLYNGFRIRSPRENLGVVEGFPSVWWLHQNGFPCVVSTMGAECSDEQATLIVSLVKPCGHVWIVPDGDKAGERFAHALLVRLAPHRFVRWVKLSAGRQPTDMSAEELKSHLET